MKKKVKQFESHPLSDFIQIDETILLQAGSNLGGSLGPQGQGILVKGWTKVNYNSGWIMDIFEMDSANRAGTMIHRGDIFNMLGGNEWNASSWYLE